MRTWSLRANTIYCDEEALFHLDGFRTPDGAWVYDHMRKLRAFREFIVDACNEKEQRGAGNAHGGREVLGNSPDSRPPSSEERRLLELALDKQPSP